MESSRSNWVLGLVRTMRLRQWPKNGFIFIPLLFDKQFTHVDALLRVTLGYFLFCFAASTIYLINDVVDIEKDIHHPIKKFRAIPSGQLPIPIAVAAAIILLIVSLVGALLLPAQENIPSGGSFALVLGIYLALQIAYSFWLKNIVIIDVLAIAGGFVLRMVAGVVIITVTNFSPWLYVCIGMLSLFLAVGKRRQELILLAGNATAVRATYKEYNLDLLNDMLRMVTTGSVLSYTLYTVEAQTKLAKNGQAMLLTLPFVFYGIFRYLYLIHVKGEGGAPDEVLFKDKPLLISVILFVLAVGAIIYL